MYIKIGCPFCNLSFKAQIYSKEVFFLVRLNFMIWGDDNLKMEVVINKCHLFFFFRSKPVGPEQILLRGANLRNTQWVFGEF